MNYRLIERTDYLVWDKLIQELWEMDSDKSKREFETLFTNSSGAIGAFDDKHLVGVVHVTLRNDYVAGTSTSPVGYIEGIVVTSTYRKQGIASSLLIEAEVFAKNKGCTEMGCDVEIDNEASLKFHLRNGYNEEERVIALSKKI